MMKEILVSIIFQPTEIASFDLILKIYIKQLESKCFDQLSLY